jgi:hypothetical protein
MEEDEGAEDQTKPSALPQPVGPFINRKFLTFC